MTSGAFAVTGVSASAPDGRWTPGETATVRARARCFYYLNRGVWVLRLVLLTRDNSLQVTVRGEILDKHILAGTAKFKLYEFGITHFVASGNSPYFHCTNKVRMSARQLPSFVLSLLQAWLTHTLDHDTHTHTQGCDPSEPIALRLQ